MVLKDSNVISFIYYTLFLIAPPGVIAILETVFITTRLKTGVLWEEIVKKKENFNKRAKV